MKKILVSRVRIPNVLAIPVVAVSMTLGACGSHDATHDAVVTAPVEAGATSPGKPQPNAALVRTESVQAMGSSNQLRVSIEPKAGVRIVNVSFPGERQVELLRQDLVPEIAGKTIARHILELGVAADSAVTSVTALLTLESNGKQFGQVVLIPMQPGVARMTPEPVVPAKTESGEQVYDIKEMPAAQEVIRD